MDRPSFSLFIIGSILSAGLVISGCASHGDAVFQPAVAKLMESASALKNEGKTAEAICRMTAAAELSPEIYQVQYNLGVLYTETNSWPEAIQHLEKAVEINPKEPNGFYTLGYAYESLGDVFSTAVNSPLPTEPEKKEELPEIIREISPEEAQAKSTESYQKAIEIYQQFMEVAPPNDPARADVQAQLDNLKSKFPTEGGMGEVPQE
jgi:tetratricopeptide (TPR) repeat protein